MDFERQDLDLNLNTRPSWVGPTVKSLMDGSPPVVWVKMPPILGCV